MLEVIQFTNYKGSKKFSVVCPRLTVFSLEEVVNVDIETKAEGCRESQQQRIRADDGDLASTGQFPRIATWLTFRNLHAVA